MPDFGFDDWMDAELRNVPVPRDLEARLRGVRASMDSRGPNEPEIAGPQLSPSDARIDRTLRNVEVPRGLGRKLRAIARPRLLAFPTRSIPRGVWAAAASVMIFAGAGSLLAIWSVEPVAGPVARQDPTPRPAPSPAKSLAETKPKPAARARRSAPRLQTPVTVALGDQPNATGGLVSNMNEMGAALRRAFEAQQRAKFALGSAGQLEPLPDLAMLEPPVARGIAPPRVRGYDLLFQLRHGEHPFVAPAAHQALETSRAPLTLRTASFDRAAARIANGRLPAKNDVRVEDFLATQAYHLPEARVGSVAVHAAACPAPLGQSEHHLLQIIVQGAELPATNRPATRLIAVVDTSSAMRGDARAKQVTRALAKLGHQMRSDDRLTLIGYADVPKVLLENASGQDLKLLAASGGLEPSGGRADLLAAIQAAAEAVSGLPANESRRVIFIGAGSELAGAQRTAARDALLKLTGSGTPWSIVELSAAGGQSPWQDLAAAGRGQTSICDSADQLLAACVEALNGRSTRLATNLSMKVQFNPKAVAGYRLLGHEAATLTGTAGDPLEIDLHAGQTPTCMYELSLKPREQTKKGPVPLNLGTVELSWRHPASGQLQRRVLALGESTVSPSFSAAPAWLQQGILAARTAELLRGSQFVTNTRRLGPLLEFVGETDPQAAATPEFRELVRLIEQADRLR